MCVCTSGKREAADCDAAATNVDALTRSRVRKAQGNGRVSLTRRARLWQGLSIGIQSASPQQTYFLRIVDSSALHHAFEERHHCVHGVGHDADESVGAAGEGKSAIRQIPGKQLLRRRTWRKETSGTYCCAHDSARPERILAFALKRSSRVIPGPRARPAVITTISEQRAKKSELDLPRPSSRVVGNTPAPASASALPSSETS
eukprot:scaffold3102_cov198-Pinguiococcus_pyrenoidosus.AAC.2